MAYARSYTVCVLNGPVIWTLVHDAEHGADFGDHVHAVSMFDDMSWEMAVCTVKISSKTILLGNMS
jgi:hypothetical protein